MVSGGAYDPTNGFTVGTAGTYSTININEPGDVSIIFTNNNGDGTPALKGIFIDEVVINDYKTQTYTSSTTTQSNDAALAGSPAEEQRYLRAPEPLLRSGSQTPVL